MVAAGGTSTVVVPAVSASSGVSTATSSAAGSTEGTPVVAPTEAAGVASPPAVAGGVASNRGAVSATGAPVRTSAAAGGAGGAVGGVADPSAVVVEEAYWRPNLPAEESLVEAKEEVGRVVLASIIKIRIKKGQGELTTHVELRTPHPAWKNGDCLLPEAGAPGDRRGSSTVGVSGGGGGACCCRWGGGGGGACCCCCCWGCGRTGA
jgi:hypothetical protein